jgi:asparagine synthase (glutamine-hydrolysing)
MVPRGPDGGSVTAVQGSDNFDALLGARRLAIIDPSSAGHQPFCDHHRGNVVVYNGMIYNYRELRRDLEAAGERFESACDTEVVLRAYGRYGAECVSRLQGMFAFALWDAGRQMLVIARDRIGIKPLYYSIQSNRFLFASQLKTLLASGLIPVDLSSAGIESFLSFGAVREPGTILKSVEALPAAHYGSWSRDGLRLHEYWTPPRAGISGATDPTATQMKHVLDRSVERHLVSDAPVGVFLSGGLDSSLVAGLADRHKSRLKTVSIQFAEEEFSEASYQHLVASHLHSDHEDVQLGAQDLLKDLPAIFDAMDQPTFDGVNTYAVSRAASDVGLKVALSGLGADELFDGYGTVRRMKALVASRRILPPPLQRAASSVAGGALSGTKGKKVRAWLSGEFPADASYDLLRRLFLPDEVRFLSRSSSTGPGTYIARPPDAGLHHWLSVADLTHNLRNTQLRDTDAMSMAHGLEVRVPFLDDNFVDWSLTHFANGHVLTKELLGKAAVGIVPQAVLARRKRPFELPISPWLRGPLRREVTTAFSNLPDSLETHLRSIALERVWEDFLAGRAHWMRPWALYALSSWVRSCEGLKSRNSDGGARTYVTAGREAKTPSPPS